MEIWITEPLILEGDYVKLIPLTKEHLSELEVIAKNEKIWEHFPYNGADSRVFYKRFEIALSEKLKGRQFPFVIYHKMDHKMIGSTRFLDIEPRNKKLEIGATWLDPKYWATEVNLECKLLLLSFCFENLQTLRVQLKTDENNLRSRKAIEKIGGTFEGIFRNDMLKDNGKKRNSVYFSFIEEEWLDKKILLISRLKK